MKRFLALSLLSIFAVAVVFVPVHAHEGHDHEDSSAGRQTSIRSDAADDNPTGHEAQTAPREDKLRERGNELLQDARKQGGKSREQITKACENRKANLETKINRIVERAKAHQQHYDSVFASLREYQQKKNITVPEWNSLLASSQTTQAESLTSIDALEKLKPDLDCNPDTIAATIASFKAATDQTRNDLTAYRQSLKSLLTAVKDAQN